jgi:hypothetical protein
MAIAVIMMDATPLVEVPEWRSLIRVAGVVFQKIAT